MDKDFYNSASSNKLGWEPNWFGGNEFDDVLVNLIKKWQRKHRITADGLCGPLTYRRIYAERQSDKDNHKILNIKSKDNNSIIYRGRSFEINWPKVVLWSDSNGLKLNKGYTRYTSERNITNFVNHWDVCMSSESCVKVLNKRGISVHFALDNDGTIYQLVDLNHACWHAGSRMWNHNSIGVEISNSYYPKYQSWYKKHGFGERPIISGEKVHRRSMKDFMGFYDVQLNALKALWEAVHDAVGIPYQTPLDSNGNTLKEVSSDAAAGKFSGFISHYHLTRRKIDCAGLDIKSMLDDI